MPPYIIANKNKINKNLMDLSFIIQSKAKYNFYKIQYIFQEKMKQLNFRNLRR